MTTRRIAFVGAVYPGQHGALCDHLRREGLAESWFLTTPGHAAAQKGRGDHILPFTPDGKIVGAQSYYYSSKIERSARISRGVLRALETLERDRPLDVVFAHSLWGAPHFLYDEIRAAIVSYIEFPSYRAHGWDPDYPPDQAQRIADRNLEMLHFHQVLRSDLTIVPSAHAKAMFPPELQDRIAVQFDALDLPAIPALPARDRPAAQPVTIGFAARDLSNAKGIDIFIRLVDRLIAEGISARFVALGDPVAVTYGYEQQWVERQYQGQVASFRDHLLRLYPRAHAIEFCGKLGYDDFARKIGEIDLFLYPLRFGVANWGLIEIMARGGCVIAPDRGYAAEMISDGVNGVLLPDEDDAWIAAIRALMADPARRARLGAAAAERAAQFSLKTAAPRYLELFEQAIARADARRG